MPSCQIEFLIIGQGLAGSILAIELLQAGKTVLVLDNQHQGSASKVAAGIINPVTGHRLNIGDNFFHYLPYAKQCYRSLENLLGKPFFHSIKQQRLIKNAGQHDYLQQRRQQNEYRELLRPSEGSAFRESEFGAINVNNTYMVDVPELLEAVKQHLIQQACYQADELSYQHLKLDSQGVRYHSIHANKVIFCEGYQAIHNPWLSHLPFKLAKGDVVTIEAPTEYNQSMLSWGNWLVPYRATAKLGSTYTWNDLSPHRDRKMLEKLVHSLHQHTTIEAKVIDHQTGIRPTTKARIPFIGPLSRAENAYCFNGFGSKGCLSMPYFTMLLTAHLIDGEPLPIELLEWL